MKINKLDEAWYAFFLVMVLISSSQMLNPYGFAVACLALFYLSFIQKKQLSIYYFTFSIFVTGASVLGMLLQMNAEVFVRILITSLLIPLVSLIDLRNKIWCLSLATKVIAASIILGFVGFAYALLGFPDLLRLTNPDGRELLLFLTTFSNSNFPIGSGFIIRPSFIFDEPGAYTFVIDTILLINFMIRRELRRIDWFLIVGGLITFSIAHILVSTLIVIAARKSKLLLIPAVVIVGADYLLYLSSGVSQIIDRFTIVDGALAGDNRSQLFDRAIELILEHPNGVGSSCNWDIASCIELFGPFGENPAFPAAYYGVMAASAYYFIVISLVVFIFVSLANLNRFWIFTCCAILALIAQRPFLFNLGYNLQILLIFSTLWKTIAFKPRTFINANANAK
jgi:hypothetical protein